ncbi:hypothetical protein Aperf_G00000089944 [Anoplocephala perfoliata]
MLWNYKPQTRAIRLAGHEDEVLCACFSSTGEIVASASKDRTVKLWIPNIKAESVTLRCHTATVRWVDLSSDGVSLCSASSDKSVKVWNVQRQKFIYSLSGHTNWVRCCKFSPDSRLILSSSDDKSIRLWDCRTQDCINSFSETSGFSNHIDFHPSETCFASATTNCTVKVWDLRMRRLVQQYNDHSASVQRVSFHPSGAFLLSASDDSTLMIFDLLEGRPIYTLSGHKGAIAAASFSPSGEHFASGGADYQVFLWKTNFDESLRRTSMVRDSVMDSVSIRPSVLTERRPIRDTYCSQRYQDVDQIVTDQQPRPSLVQKVIQYRGTPPTQVVSPETPDRANGTFKELPLCPLSSKENLPHHERFDLHFPAEPLQTKAPARIPENLSILLSSLSSQLNILTQASYGVDFGTTLDHVRGHVRTAAAAAAAATTTAVVDVVSSIFKFIGLTISALSQSHPVRISKQLCGISKTTPFFTVYLCFKCHTMSHISFGVIR